MLTVDVRPPLKFEIPFKVTPPVLLNVIAFANVLVPPLKVKPYGCARVARLDKETFPLKLTELAFCKESVEPVTAPPKLIVPAAFNATEALKLTGLSKLITPLEVIFAPNCVTPEPTGAIETEPPAIGALTTISALPTLSNNEIAPLA